MVYNYIITNIEKTKKRLDKIKEKNKTKSSPEQSTYNQEKSNVISDLSKQYEKLFRTSY
jgi:hypothetical protein